MTTLWIGRHSDCQVVLSDLSVSRYHATIVETGDGKFLICDEKSSGGTFLYEDSGWQRISRSLIDENSLLKFGELEISVPELLTKSKVPLKNPVLKQVVSLAGISNLELKPKKERKDVREKYIRDPETGQIVKGRKK